MYLRAKLMIEWPKLTARGPAENSRARQRLADVFAPTSRDPAHQQT
ncbi:hypothetical protein AB9K35_12025 [Leisingera sp. XS_AS12]